MKIKLLALYNHPRNLSNPISNLPSFLKDLVNGAIRTMSEMLSQYAGTAGLGTLPGMSAGAGIDKYLEARKEGYSIPRSFAAGGVTATTEYITEKTPLEILGRPGLKFIDRLMKGLIADIPGEIEATLVEMTTVDQAILGKSHTRQEYLGALLDTAATAALATIGTTGVIQPFVRNTKQSQYPDAENLHKKAVSVQKQLSTVLENVSKQYGLEYKSNQKSVESMANKVQRKAQEDIDYDYSNLKDIARGAILVNDYSQVEGVIQAIRKQMPKSALNIEVFIEKPLNAFGYRGIHLNTKIDGIGAEIQIHTKDSWKIKQQTDLIYRKWRGIEITPENEKEILEDKQKSKKLWDDYWDKVFSSPAASESLKGIASKISAPTPSNLTLPEGVKTVSGPIPSSPESKIIPENLPDVNRENRSEKPFIEQPPEKNTENKTKSTIPQQPESVKPDIQFMPALKSLVDTGKLSIEDALEIDNIARQNHWSEDTVKQFYENAVKGLGIPNKDTASLEQMLIVAKVKEAVYKQNAEQYKQEIAINEKLLDQFYRRLKIQGGAPDKYETAANDFLKNLGDLKDLKPEEIIQKAQKEFALNLNRLDNPNLNFWTKYFLRANKKT